MIFRLSNLKKNIPIWPKKILSSKGQYIYIYVHNLFEYQIFGRICHFQIDVVSKLMEINNRPILTLESWDELESWNGLGYELLSRVRSNILTTIVMWYKKTRSIITYQNQESQHILNILFKSSSRFHPFSSLCESPNETLSKSQERENNAELYTSKHLITLAKMTCLRLWLPWRSFRSIITASPLQE